MRVLICEKINCPHWSSDHTKSYGCQRYRTSSFCHLMNKFPSLDSRNEYALYADLSSAESPVIARLKMENDRYFS